MVYKIEIFKIYHGRTHLVSEQHGPINQEHEKQTIQVSRLKTACGSPLTNKTVSTIFEGRKIYFCEKECSDEFNLDPKAFLKSEHFLIRWEDLEKVA